jgi:hypothetical protein
LIYKNQYGYYDCNDGTVCTKCEKIFGKEVKKYDKHLCFDCKALTFEIGAIYVLYTGHLVRLINIKNKYTLEVLNWEQFNSNLYHYVYDVLFEDVIGKVIEIPLIK